MRDSRLERVKNSLVAKGINIRSDNEWLEGCFNWCISSEPQANDAAIEKFVYDQWLLADLRDIGESNLPDTVESTKSIINGKYALQVDSFLDVGHSCYSQMEKIKKTVSSNVEVGDTKPQSWEPKSSRMLKLTCTDGVRTVFGMEYKPISALREPFVPGLKIVVTGPVECRKSVLLLEPHHIQVLGGETDSLLIPNAVENVLARILNLEENPNPYQNVATAVSHVNEVVDDRTDPEDQVPDTRTVERGPVVQVSSASTQNTFADAFTDSDDDLMLCSEAEQIESYFSQEMEHSNLGYRSAVTAAPTASGSAASSVTSNVNQYAAASVNSDVSHIQRVVSEMQSSHRGTSLAQSSPSILEKREDSNKKPVVGIACQIVPTSSTNRLVEHKPSTSSSKYWEDVFTDNQQELTDDSGFISLSSSSTNFLSMPVTKISELKTKHITGPRIVYVQGAVQKLTSKPKIHNNSWKLQALINDDTDSMEVSFSNSLLEKVFGRTALQMVTDKSLISTDPILKEQVSFLLKDGTKRISTMKGRIKLEYASTTEIPCVLDITH